MPGDGKRRHKRHFVDGVRGNVLYTSDIDVLNISLDGVSVETTRRLELKREYTFKVRYKDTSLDLKGRVVWAVLLSKEKKDTRAFVPVYRAGIRFTNVSGEKAGLLQQFIDENKVRTLEPRVGGVRFRIASSEDVKVDLPRKYEVKRVSLSGMLVETEYPLALNSEHGVELFLNGEAMHFAGRVAYCGTIGTDKSSVYDIGIEFVRMSESDRKSLKDFLDTLEDV
jgi:Tfp pilus assembly protein PilZ